jgi:hypothetical protein
MVQGGNAGQQIFTLTLQKHTGMLIVMRRQEFTVRGTLAQCEDAYKKTQVHNLVFGWWGLLSMLLFNWIAILGNMSAMSKVRQLAGR